MSTLSRLGKQMEELLQALKRVNVDCALIGGLALASHHVVRATRDIDFLTDADHADKIDVALKSLGYRCIHRSPNAGNYLRQDERIDFLYASRPASRQLLAGAPLQTTAFGELRVVSTEGLIAFKLQALANDPRRVQDLEDIRLLLRANMGTINMQEVAGYFQLFDREPLLKEILDEFR